MYRATELASPESHKVINAHNYEHQDNHTFLMNQCHILCRLLPLFYAVQRNAIAKDVTN